MKKNILYITYDGLSDPVGQSQILPYLKVLASAEFSIHILSLEKEDSYKKYFSDLVASAEGCDLHFHPLIYKRGIPLLSSFQNFRMLRKIAIQLCCAQRFHLTHARSYIAGRIAETLKKKFSIPFLFDMRGFWVDERVEGGLWNLRNPVYRIIYNSYRKTEKILFGRADHIVSLTQTAKEIICEKFEVKADQITVIPCAADYAFFDPSLVKPDDAENFRQKTGVKKETFVLLYTGSVGTWYMTREMLEFFSELKKMKPDSKFVFCINRISESFRKEAERSGMKDDLIILQDLPRSEMPLALNAADAVIFFIRPSFSKKASSPIKYAEALAMNKRVISNAEIGDLDKELSLYNGICISDFSHESFVSGAQHLMSENNNLRIREFSEENYGLSANAEKYLLIYRQTSEV